MISRDGLPNHKQALQSRRELVVKLLEEEATTLTDSKTLSRARSLGGGMDDPLYAKERDLALAIRERHQRELERIDNALNAMRRNVWGECSDCGRLIEADRLLADPAIPTCLTCQQLLEKTQDERDATPSL